MGLKPCKECGHQVSSSAKACPGCGAAVKSGIRCGTVVGLIILVPLLLGVIMFIVAVSTATLPSSSPSGSSAPSLPAPRPAPSASPAQPSPSPTPKDQGPAVHEAMETVSVGYWSYMVDSAEWRDYLSRNELIDEKPSAAYLVVRIAARNNDKSSSTIPPFTLLDDQGAEHSESANRWRLKDAFGPLESLNPTVQKSGYLVFDVPRDRTYRLKVSGGLMSGKSALINLRP